MPAAIFRPPRRSPGTPPAPSSTCIPSPMTTATSTAPSPPPASLLCAWDSRVRDHALRNRPRRLHLLLRLRHRGSRPALRLARHRRAGIPRRRRGHRRLHDARFRQPTRRFPPHPRPARPNAPAARSAPLVAHRHLLPIEVRHGLVGSLSRPPTTPRFIEPYERVLEASLRTYAISSPAIPSARR